MRFQKEHRIELPMARLIELTFSADFMHRMNIEAMKVQVYDSLERNVEGNTWTMRNRITPQDNMPGFLKKLIGGGFHYEETVTHQKGSDTVTGNMVPSVMRDKLKMNYTMRIRPDGDNACRRSMEWEVEVKIFGVGGQIEKFAAGEIERSMEASAQYLSQHGKSA
ncbi:MAG TPA: DUF2505 domain-containing protein [Pseudomonadota bacterium]|nr:DUF2505 domain-containing protein [Pseudomonadota bacterium]